MTSLGPAGSPPSVVVPHIDSPYLGQLYRGLQVLDSRGLVRLQWSAERPPGTAPVLTASVAGRSVVFDLLDGLNWTPGTARENREHFRAISQVDLYLKRSFTPVLREWSAAGTRVEPLGLNYPVAHRSPRRGDLRSRLRNNTLVRRMAGRDPVTLPQHAYEYGTGGEAKVLLATRLWDPHAPEVEGAAESERRHRLNQFRIEAVRACRAELGPQFFGGLQATPLAARLGVQDLVLDPRSVRKRAFMAATRGAQICVASNGLHGSTGWRFGEYVAASRAVLSEVPEFEAPGLVDGTHYRGYSSVDELVTQAQTLLRDADQRIALMNGAAQYYREYLRPDALVARALSLALAG